MVKLWLIFLSIFAFCISTNNARLPKNTVIIENALQHHKNLKVHCRSADDDLRLRILSPGASFNFSFRDHVIVMTIFWCDLWQGPGYKHHQMIFAYVSQFYTEYGAIYLWETRENGIYLCKNGNPCELKYRWDVPSDVANPVFVNDGVDLSPSSS